MDEPTLKGRAGLYDIMAPDGTSIAKAVTIQEASDITGLSKACIRQASILGHRAGKKYHVTMIDVVLGRNRDEELFTEWDEVRIKLLKRYGRKS